MHTLQFKTKFSLERLHQENNVFASVRNKFMLQVLHLLFFRREKQIQTMQPLWRFLFIGPGLAEDLH